MSTTAHQKLSDVLSKGRRSSRSQATAARRRGQTRSYSCWAIPFFVVAATVLVWATSSWVLDFRDRPSYSAVATPKNEEPENSKLDLTVAFAISITSLELPKALSLLDAAEVLIGSIDRTCKLSRYRCIKVAFVLPSIPDAGWQHLRSMGWTVLEKDLPVAVADIENEAYRNHVVESGCCGANEFLKLHAYTLTEYHRVLHLDVDTLVLHPMDELMDMNASFLYTTDPAMSPKGQTVLPVQGGFLLLRPDLEVYKKLCDIIRRGNWKIGEGWEGSKIGYFYGGATIQGLLAYFYHVVAPEAGVALDRCIYNHLSDFEKCRSAPYSAVSTDGVGGVTIGNATVGDGGLLPIKTVHFTQSCSKPWKCREFRVGANMGRPGPCASLQNEWLKGRHTLFTERGLPFQRACGQMGYSPVPRD